VSERRTQIESLLARLAKHADLVAEAFEGELAAGGKPRQKGIDVLMEIGAVKPYDEGVYRLNPRLREFLADAFSTYSAYQALRSVSGTLKQARNQWAELSLEKESGRDRNLARLQMALDDSFVDIAYSIDHNLKMLHTLLGNKYGNVDGMDAKLRQNKYYLSQVESFRNDMVRIGDFVERVQEEAIAAGMLEIRSLVYRRLGANLLKWTGQIKDAQAAISKRLFDTRLLGQRLKRLADVSLWLDQRKTASGFEIDTEGTEALDAALFRPVSIKLRPQIDAADQDPVVVAGLDRILATLPAPKVQRLPQPPSEPQKLLATDDEVFVPAPEPHAVALGDLLAVILASEQPVSVRFWKQGRADLSEIEDGAWLMFAYSQLKSVGIEMSLTSSRSEQAMTINEVFSDIVAAAGAVTGVAP